MERELFSFLCLSGFPVGSVGAEHHRAILSATGIYSSTGRVYAMKAVCSLPPTFQASQLGPKLGTGLLAGGSGYVGSHMSRPAKQLAGVSCAPGKGREPCRQTQKLRSCKYKLDTHGVTHIQAKFVFQSVTVIVIKVVASHPGEAQRMQEAWLLAIWL